MIINIQEMVWNIVNNLDYETAKKVSLEDRVPFLELTGLLEVREINELINYFDRVCILTCTHSH